MEKGTPHPAPDQAHRILQLATPEGSLESSLKEKLKVQGVEFNPVPEEELVEKLSKERVSRLSSLLGTFLNHAKSSNLDQGEIVQRSRDQKDRGRSERFP